MNADGKARLIEAGVDIDGALHRFLNNEAMYEKFLLKFPDDTNFGNLVQQEAEGDFGGIFSFSHALKGTAGNLGLEPVRAVASEITELVRGKSEGEIDKDAVSAQVKLLVEKYNVVCEAIRAL